MADLTYKEPVPPPRPFKRGDMVEVLDRDHTVLSQQRVREATKNYVTTECGRIWTQGGWWVGEDDRAWPFPSIRLTQ